MGVSPLQGEKYIQVADSGWKEAERPMKLKIAYPEYSFSNLSIKLSRDTFATILADAIDVNLRSPDTIFR